MLSDSIDSSFRDERTRPQSRGLAAECRSLNVGQARGAYDRGLNHSSLHVGSIWRAHLFIGRIDVRIFSELLNCIFPVCSCVQDLPCSYFRDGPVPCPDHPVYRSLIERSRPPKMPASAERDVSGEIRRVVGLDEDRGHGGNDRAEKIAPSQLLVMVLRMAVSGRCGVSAHGTAKASA